MKLMWNLSVICQKCRSIYFKMWSDMFYRTTKRYHNTQTISGESVNKYCREDTIESPSYFFRIWNLQNRSVAAQFGGCFKWLKRHCRSCWHTFQTKWNLGLHIYCGFFLSMATSLASRKKSVQEMFPFVSSNVQDDHTSSCMSLWNTFMINLYTFGNVMRSSHFSKWSREKTN